MKPEDVRSTLEKVTEDMLRTMDRSHGNYFAAIFLGASDDDDCHYTHTPEDINDGKCMFWAQQAVDALGGPSPECCAVWVDNGEELSEWEFSHVVLFYKGKYYDSEILDGVERPIDIPYFRELKEEDLFLTFMPELEELERSG